MKKNYLLLICFFVTCLSNSQTINFPDPNLRQLFLDGIYVNGQGGNPITIDINGDGEIQQSEALLVYGFSLDYSILNGEGLQYFTNVENIFFEGGNPALTMLDLSALTNLKYLVCRYTAISSISFSGSSLIGLLLDNNIITNIDLSVLAGSPNLLSIDLSNNNFSSIDLSPLGTCSNLSFVNLNNNNLTALDWAPLAGNTTNY